MSAMVFDPKRKAYIPAGIAACGAGKDAYLRKLKNECSCCRAEFVLNSSDSPELCAECYEIAGIENAIADGDDPADYADEIAGLKASIVAKGGSLKNIDV